MGALTRTLFFLAMAATLQERPYSVNRAYHTETIETTVDGVLRHAEIAAPLGSPRAIVLWFHPDGGDGRRMHDLVRFEDLLSFSAVIAYPSGVDGSWDLETPTATNKDVHYTQLLMDQLRGRYHLDAAPAYAAGFSNGAYFVHALACRVPGLLRAIAAHSGGPQYETPDNPLGRYPNGYYRCDPRDSRVSALVVHGGQDHSVAPENAFLGAKYWAYVDGCAEAAPTTGSCVEYTNCRGPFRVRRCVHPGYGHELTPDYDRQTADFFSAAQP